MPRSTTNAAAHRDRIARRIDAIQRAAGPSRPWTAAAAADALGITRRGARKIIEQALRLKLIVALPAHQNPRPRTPRYRKDAQ